MAKSSALKVLETVNRSPAKIILTEKFQGRVKPVANAELVTLADSMRVRGQEQPIQGRAVEGTDKLEAIFGNTRTRAGLLILNGYTDNNGKDIPANPEFTLRCEVVDCTDEEAFSNNIIENAHRNKTTAIDDAQNHQKLRDEYEMTDAAITRMYGYAHQSSVTQLKKLLELPQDVQNKIHDGIMSKQAGLLLVNAKDVNEAGAFEAVMALVTQDGDDEHGIGASQVGVAIKAWREKQKAASATTTEAAEGGEGSEEGTPGAIPLTFAKLKGIFTDTVESARTPAKMKKCVKDLLAVMTGEKEMKTWAKWLMKEFGETLLPEPEVTPEAAAATEGEAPAEEPASGKKKHRNAKQRAAEATAK